MRDPNLVKMEVGCGVRLRNDLFLSDLPDQPDLLLETEILIHKSAFILKLKTKC
jgi:hypothetical protein